MNEFIRNDTFLKAHEILRLVSLNRARCYRMLAAAFSYPDEALAQQLTSGRFLSDFLQATTWLGEDQSRLVHILSQMEYSTIASLEHYQAEYSRFFEKSIDRVSQHEASYRWKDASILVGARNDLGRTLQHQYGQFGVYCTPGLEDHIAVELEFLSFLCDRETIFWTNRAAKTARGLRSQQRTFMDDHLGRWLPEFCHRLKKRAGNSFYGWLAWLCDEWQSLDQGQGYVSIRD